MKRVIRVYNEAFIEKRRMAIFVITLIILILLVSTAGMARNALSPFSGGIVESKVASSREIEKFSKVLRAYLSEEYDFISGVSLTDIVKPKFSLYPLRLPFQKRFKSIAFDFVVFKKVDLDIICAFDIQSQPKIMVIDCYRDWAHEFVKSAGVNVFKVKAKKQYNFQEIIHIFSLLMISKPYPIDSEPFVSTKGLARKFGVTEHAMSQYLYESGFLELCEGHYRLTHLGKLMGGVEKVSAYFGTYWLWPSHIHVALHTDTLQAY